MKPKRTALFLSHGGGPLPLLGDEGHAEMVACLKRIANTIEKPSAIIVVSAHWEASPVRVTAAPSPDLIYDYYGFPEESYQISYPCSGHSELAETIASQLESSGIQVGLDRERGFDHGVFVPLKIMYPEADIPCVELSLIKGLDPAAHIKLGQALQGIGDESTLLIGSGFSFHNMKAFFTADTEETRGANQAFESWLVNTCSDQNLSEPQRTHKLINWEEAPFARYCQPREEHLLPLHVCYGYASAPCSQSYELNILNKLSSMFLWEVTP